MPTIELVSIDCSTAPKLPKYSSFAYILESKLESHRGLFQSVFDSLSGIIIHLGNKDLEEEKDDFWFAGKLMDWKYDENLVFLPNSFKEVADLMQKLIILSPQKHILFSSDYQFGGEKKQYDEVALSQFFKLHDQKKLHYNSIYFIYSDI